MSPRKAAAAKAAPKAAAKKKPAAQPEAIEAPWSPQVGELVGHEGNIIALTSLDPLEAEIYVRRNQVVTQKPYTLTSLEGVEPLNKQDIYERLR